RALPLKGLADRQTDGGAFALSPSGRFKLEANSDPRYLPCCMNPKTLPIYELRNDRIAALKYSPDGSAVTLSGSCADGTVSLSVQN
ncbi:MAG TPA: hypothetical protein PLD51_08305, partial [Pontiellaceae bacterium]|nr:hypothetical protein [Pontiellaceae bacterium]